MNRLLITNIFSKHNIVCVLGFIFCVIWIVRCDSFLMFAVTSFAALFLIILGARIKTKFFKIVVPFLLIWSFLLFIPAALLKYKGIELIHWSVLSDVIKQTPELIAITYAFVTPILTSASENIATSKEKNIYTYPARIILPLWIMLMILSAEMAWVIILGALTGILASGLIKNRYLTGIGFIVYVLFVAAICFIPILGIDKVVNKDEAKVMQVDSNNVSHTILRKIHISSKRIYSIGSVDKTPETDTVQEPSFAQNPVHYPTIFVALRNKVGNWAYCIPLLLLGCISYITTRALKYSNIVHKKVLGNIMINSLFMMVLFDWMRPFIGTTDSTFHKDFSLFSAIMIGITASCIKEAKKENEMYYSLSE